MTEKAEAGCCDCDCGCEACCECDCEAKEAK